MRTSDGGRHWHSILSTGATVVELWVVPDRVWALTSCDAATSACAPRLLRSADGGVTWSASRTNLAWLSFGDPRDGWAAPTSGSSAYRTIDGGATWTRVRSPCADSPVRPLRALAFDSASMGLAVCAATLGAGGEFKSVLQTTDGGATWHVRASVGAPPIPSVGSVPYFGYVRGLVVAHDGAAWLWGDRMVPVESGDAGITWQPLGIGIPDALLVTAAWPLDARDGFVLLWDPNRQSTLVEVTADDGRTWQERASLPIATVPVVP